MISQKQLAANRANFLKSTGPRTPDGKARVSQNPVKHGLLSREVVMKGESKDEFEKFRGNLLMDLAPEGELECMLSDRIIAATWRLRRTVRIEREMLEDKPSYSDDTLGKRFASDVYHGNTYGKFSRYEGHIERGMYKALHELQRLQASRQDQPVSPPLALDVDVSGAGSGIN